MPSEILACRPDSDRWPAPANSYFLKDDRGGVLIDAGCGYQECYEKIKEFMAGIGLSPADIHTVVLSHAHPDHMGALPFLLAESSPRIYIHEIEKSLAIDPQLLNSSFDMCHIRDYYLDRLGGTEPAGIIEYFSGLCPMGTAVPTDTVTDGDVLALGGRDFEVIHTPGHAPGHIALYDRQHKVLLSGDLVGSMVAWYCPSGGGARGYLESLDRIDSLELDLILPSHGPDIPDPHEAIELTRAYILAREQKILELLAEGPRSLLELTDDLFPSPVARMFPGIQITDSHMTKLEEDGRALREVREGMPFFSLLQPAAAPQPVFIPPSG